MCSLSQTFNSTGTGLQCVVGHTARFRQQLRNQAGPMCCQRRTDTDLKGQAFVAALAACLLLQSPGSCVHAQQSEPASTSPEQKQGEDDELLTAPDLEVEDLTSRQLDQVVDDLKTEILPQAKELLKLVERQAGTTVPTSFKESLETVVMEAEKLLQQVNAETGEPSESITGFKATADGIEQQLIVFRQLLDISDPGQMKARPPASRMK